MLIVKWPLDVLARFTIPEQSKSYLAHQGLPEFVSIPWLEFGVYDSSPDLVIGQASDDIIIVVRGDGLVELENSEGHCIYINRNVETLGDFFIHFLNGRNLLEVRAKMNELDPEAMRSSQDCFWPQVLDYEEATNCEIEEAEQASSSNGGNAPV
jgi:hypothetical protein